MNVKRFLNKTNFQPDAEELLRIKEETKEFCDLLREQIMNDKIDADVFVGGSFAKGTLTREDNYDVDVFVRFDWEYEDLSPILKGKVEKVAKKMSIKLDSVHGSR